MFGLWLEGNYRWKPHFLPLIWTVLLAAAPLTAVGYFLGDTKAILNGCEDQWTLQSAVVIPRLFQMTVCVDVHVVVPGAWAAFLYTSVRGPNPDLGLEGDTTAIYGWLLQVRHRFPLKLTPMQWHRVCLRRDAKGNTFSLEVDGRMVAERTVIAQAIPPSGTLWLGCNPRLQPPGAELGKVELYLFRMWADLNSHDFCEDGTVIGWDSRYWSVTSSKAKEKDPYLLCEKKRVRREASIVLTSGATTGPGISREFSTDSKFTPSTPNPSSTVKLTTPPITTAGNQLATGTHVYPTRSGAAGTVMSVEESPVLKCDTRQLCSNDSAYFWMSVTARAGDITASDFQNLVSKTFTCGNTTNSQPKNFTDFCQNGGNIKVVEASCSAPNVTISTTTCGILLLLNGTVSACDLQLFAKSVLQLSAGQMMPNLTVQVERVGQNLCEGLSPSEGRFVRCTSMSSLEDICRSNAHTNITCSVLEPDFQPVSEPGSSSCSESAQHFCDCTAFCNSTSQFYAMKLNINNQSFTVDALKSMFLKFPNGASCSPTSLCKKLKYESVRLECHGTPERLYSCMVIVEMSGQVDECALKETVQNIIKNNPNIKIDKPLTRMMVCGSTGSSLQTLLESNFTWATSNLQPSDVCQTEPTLPLCEIGETLAVLMTDICPSQLFTTQPPTQSTTTPAPILHINTTNTQLTTLSARLTTRQSSTSQPVSLTNTNSVTTAQKNLANKTPLPPTQTLTTDGGLTTHTTVTQSTTEHYKQSQTVTGADSDINTTDANNNSIGVKTSSYTVTEAFLSQSYTTQSTIPSLNNNYTIEKHETTTSKDNTQSTSVTQTINNSHIFKTTETSSKSTEEHTAAAAINKHTTIGNAETQANYYSVHTTARSSNNHTTSQDNNTRSNTTSYKSMPSTDNTTPRHTNTTAYSTRASSDDTTSKSTRHSNNDTNLHSTTTPNNDNTTSNSTSAQDNKNATLYTTTSSRDEDTTLTNTTSYDIMPTNDNKTPSNINTTLHSTTAHTTNNTTLKSTALDSTKTPINNHTKSYTTTPRNNDTNNVITALNKSNSPHHVATTTSINSNTAVVHPTITNNYTTMQTISGATETATATLVSLASYTDSKQSTSTEVPFSRTGTYKKTESYTTSGPFTSRGYTTQSDASNTNTSHATVQFLTSTSRNSTTLDETTTTTHNTTTNVSPETTDTFIKLHNATPQSNSSSTPTSPPPQFQSTAETNDTVMNNTSTLDVLTAHTTADPETTAAQNHTSVHTFTSHNNKSVHYNNSVTAETSSSTLSPTASSTDSQQLGSNYTQDNNASREISNYTTTGPLTSPNYSTQNNALNTFDSYTTENNLTTSDIAITNSQISAVTHNTTAFLSNYTTSESPSSINNNLTPNSNATTARNIYTTVHSDTTEYDTTTSNNFTTNIPTLSSSYTTVHSTTSSSDNTTSDSETTVTQNYTTPPNFSNASNKSLQYNSSVTTETESTTLTPTSSYTDSQHMGSNYTQDNNESREISNNTTTGPLTSPNYSTQNNALNTFDSNTTENNVTTSDIAITNSQISAVTHNTTAFLSNYTTPESPSSIHNNLTTNNNATTARNIYTTGYNTTENSDTTEYDTTPSNNFTTNIPTLSSSYTTVHNTTSSSDNTRSDSETRVTQTYTTPHNFSNVSNKSVQYNSSITTETKSTTLTPTSSYTDSQQIVRNYTQDYNENGEISNNTTTGPLTSPNYSTQKNALNTFDSNTTENNLSTSDIAITNSQINTVTQNTTAFTSNYTTPESPSSINNNLTTNSNATTARNIYTTGYNKTENSDTTEYDTTPSNNFTTNIPTLSSSYTTVHSTTSSSDNTTSDSETTVTQNYTPHNFSNVSNKSIQYNSSGTTDTMSTTLTPLSSYTDSQPTTLISSNYTQDYNESRETSNYTTVHSTTSSSENTTLNSDSTTTQNYTISHNSSNISNKSALYNSSVTTETMSTTLTPTSSYTDSQHTTLMSSNYTQDCNGSRETSNCTAIKPFTSENYSTQNNVSAPFNGYTTVKDVIERQNNTTQNTTIIYNNFTTPANLTPISKKDDNATTTRNSSTNTNYTTENSNTTLYVTTPSYNLTMRNNATVLGSSSLTQSTTKSSSNYPTMYNIATTSYNHQTTHETTAQSKSNFTVNNATTANSKPEAIYNTTAFNSNTIANNATTPGSNSTEVYSLLTTKEMHNTTPSTSYKTLNNTTVPDSNDTTTDNEVLVHNGTIADSSYTTTAPALTSVCPNKTITCSTTIAPISNPQHVTNTVNMNTTVTSAAAQKSETTPTKNTNVDILKSTHTTKSPQVSMKTTDTTTVNTNMYLTISGGSIHKTTGPGGNTLPTTTTTPNPAKVSTTTAKAVNAVTTTTGLTSTTTSEGETQLNDLSNLTKDPSQLSSSEISNVAKALEEILQGPSISKSFGQKALDVISNLLDADVSALSGSANRLTKMVERLSVSLKVTGGTETLSAKSLVLSVRTVDGTNFVETAADIVSTDNVQHSPSRTKRSTSPLGSVFLPSSLTSGLTPEEQLKASRVQFTFYTKNTLFQDISLNNQTNVSQILGLSVANLSISNLKDNVRFKIRNPGEQQIDLQATNATCVFWDYALNDEKGGWRSDGCFVLNITSTHTTCSCNHLTSFAVLLDLSREGIMDKQQAEILTFITYIGCGISSIFLSVTLLTYLLFPKLLRDIPAKILVQLSLSLLLLNLVFLLDSWLSLYDAVGLCISTAFFLHYFLLTSFTWAGLEALHMYLSIVRVFTPYLNQYMLKFSLMGWGIPLIVVIIVISVDKDNYGPVGYNKYTNATSNDFCWLRNDIAFYVGVVAYFLLIFVLCLLVFIVVMYQLSRIKKQNPHNQSPNRSMMTDMRSIVGLFLLLGLTWGFALFAWGPLYLPFVYLFSIFNSLQGFFLFVFHCAVKENVRRQWRIYLCCGKLRLLENQDSSRTATNKRKTTSMATGTTSNPMSTSRGSVVSDVTNSSGSAPADSGISSGSNIDVLLNEIHTANLNLQSEA